MTLIEAARLSENDARRYFEKLRWPSGPICPHCESKNHTRLRGAAHREGTIQCNDCRQQYTVTVGSVMESSKIPLHKWVLGFHLLCSSKKGISALQLQRELGLGSYRTAWFMSHRIRHAMNETENQLGNVVEADETYVGGQAKNKHASKKAKDKSRYGRNTDKTPVAVLVERNGNAIAMPVQRVDIGTLGRNIRENVREDAVIVTDEWSGYKYVGERQRHEVISHKTGEYVREAVDGLKVTTNTAESFIALVKRAYVGAHHHYSEKHMARYISEAAFRWNNRKVSDGKRRDQAIRQASGKRLQYERPAA